MTDQSIGIATRRLRQPLRRALATAGRLGADGVQIDLRTELPIAECSSTALREIRKLLDDQRVRLGSVVYPTRRGFGDEADLDRRVAATMQAMSIAAQLGADALITTAAAGAADGGQLIESLTALGRHAEHVGVRLAMPVSPDGPEPTASLLANLPEATVGIDFHPAALLSQGISMEDALSKLGPKVVHVTAADAVHDLADRRVIEVALGRGSVDWAALMAGLEAHGFRGWVTVDGGEGRDPVGETDNAIRYLRTLLRDL
ncbi:MAG: sugar phosphate isomerase/epimerase [Planctomycetota bacterium]